MRIGIIKPKQANIDTEARHLIRHLCFVVIGYIQISIDISQAEIISTRIWHVSVRPHQVNLVSTVASFSVESSFLTLALP
ncbi:hypothetical protein OH492_14580 [Vibrio chagasii]|nr:hypothetical protein [Vibrio chagasii]